jgi:hypothetical protein
MSGKAAEPKYSTNSLATTTVAAKSKSETATHVVSVLSRKIQYHVRSSMLSQLAANAIEHIGDKDSVLSTQISDLTQSH